MKAGDELLQVLRDPAAAGRLTDEQWDRLLVRARAARLLGRLARRIDSQTLAALAPRVRDHLVSEGCIASQHARVVRWEIARIAAALADVCNPLVLLKGAAYIAAKLGPAPGRMQADVDILVPREQLGATEQALLTAGWEPMTHDRYDQRFYRQWMHELPPLRHRDRCTVLDVHHTILPPAGRVQVDGQTLLAAAVPLPGWNDRRRGEPLYRLCDADLVLHVAAHLFQDGDLNQSVRELVDLHDLIAPMAGGEEAFWDRLVGRAGEFGLSRPLCYSLRHAQRMLGTSVPPHVQQALGRQTGRCSLWVMDRLAPVAMLPDPANGAAPMFSRLARVLLYVRSHWLRLSPLRLLTHLCRKAGRQILAGRVRSSA